MKAEFRRRALAVTAQPSLVVVHNVQEANAVKAALEEVPTWTCTLAVADDAEGKTTVLEAIRSLRFKYDNVGIEN